MDEIDVLEDSNRKRIKQPVSVPFLWEEKPGIPKKNWKPSAPLVAPFAAPPVKLVASVPFTWEEKPGRPLPCFSQPPLESVLLPPATTTSFTSTSVSSQENNDNWDGSFGGGGGDTDYEQDEMFEVGLDAWEVETEESFSSVPSLLANRLVPTMAIFNAVPVHQTSLMVCSSDQLETASSPISETDSTGSYATGTTSLVGAPFLECLFPLLSPKSGFLDKVGCSEIDNSRTAENAQSRDSPIRYSVPVRRPLTLGELIMMSRRRSYQRKAVQMHKQNLSMELMKNGALGCCTFGTGIKIWALQRKWKQQLLLKLQ
ncbi:hypothetical protein RJ640_022895 [Escallonia rubra]|uniref:Hydroxyproline-rich glycoprotein family protein n=1 Tax=Escallonia rubra TaxID=112253 RepID=A0AA88R2R1_9ASTE|nr:hypothetical protein RJ640_022895 [Escallonia rubra]